MGAGKTELGKALVGLQKTISGKIILEDREISIRSPADALRYGIFYLPEDRRKEGLVSLLSVSDNIIISPTTLMRISAIGLVRRIGVENDIAKK